MTIDEAKIKQNKFAEKLDELRAYPAKSFKCINLKESVSKYVKNIYDGWEKFFNEFKNGILPLSKKDGTKTDSTWLTHDVPETSSEGPLKVLMSGTSRGPSGYS